MPDTASEGTLGLSPPAAPPRQPSAARHSSTVALYGPIAILSFESFAKCGSGKEPQVHTLTFERSIGASTKQLALHNLALDSTDEQLPHDDGNDLLDLLDSVA